MTSTIKDCHPPTPVDTKIYVAPAHLVDELKQLVASMQAQWSMLSAFDAPLQTTGCHLKCTIGEDMAEHEGYSTLCEGMDTTSGCNGDAAGWYRRTHRPMGTGKAQDWLDNSPAVLSQWAGPPGWWASCLPKC